MHLPFAAGNFFSSSRIISTGNGHNDWREKKETGRRFKKNNPITFLTPKQDLLCNHVMKDHLRTMRQFFSSLTLIFNLKSVNRPFRNFTRR